jgi:hypothetical protein
MPKRGVDRRATIYAHRFDPISGLKGLLRARAFTVKRRGSNIPPHSLRHFL